MLALSLEAESGGTMSQEKGHMSKAANHTTPSREAVAKAQEALADEAGVDIRSRWVELDDGLALHLLEAGEGEPLILLHGSGNNSASWVPLMERPLGRRVVAVDRPGYGLSSGVAYRRVDYRQTAVALVTRLLDALEIDKADIVGNSTGAVWALWTAIDQPGRVQRLVLAGATPLLPGTTPPFPLRLMTTPGIGSLLGKLMPDPTPESVEKMMAGMGEGDTIGDYPRLIDVFMAASSDPVAGKASQTELSLMIRGFAGFRRGLLFTEQELWQISSPILLIWGDHDPVGDVEAARRAENILPQTRLEVLPTGHAPWWGEPDKTAALISGFLGSE
jgi:pimeloyl-ACP methyl ester carboxylesterase